MRRERSSRVLPYEPEGPSGVSRDRNVSRRRTEDTRCVTLIASGKRVSVTLFGWRPDPAPPLSEPGLARLLLKLYQGDSWTDREADGAELASGIRLMATPGHTAQDISTLVDTEEGLVALTHLWWDESSESDPLAEDLDALMANRARVLEIATLIVPGHGKPFRNPKT